jgi:ADP-ribose pyrophosphatase
MNEKEEPQIVYHGRHLSMKKTGKWEYATRHTPSPAVGIVAITDDNRVLLVEQFRVPVGRTVIELPAGLTGDVAGSESETLLDAAKRELFEETGYRAERWTELGVGYSSPGLTDEATMLFLAEQIKKHGEAEGDGSESITVHEVPFDDVPRWLTQHKAVADWKLFAGLFAAEKLRGSFKSTSPLGRGQE